MDQKKAEAWLGMKKVELDVVTFLNEKKQDDTVEGTTAKIQRIQDEVVSKPIILSNYLLNYMICSSRYQKLFNRFPPHTTTLSPRAFSSAHSPNSSKQWRPSDSRH